MVNAVLFMIIFLWLITLTVRQADFNRWLKTMKDERSRVLAFIDEAKASWSKDYRQEKDQ